ncbi:hypothetical protein [Streptomyces sp. NPDC093111]|uniref:hypothetical protein n=1 Tax=Streptomyces sp. NPDC093111 TaxID=3154978 RepID=UPI00342F599F
MDDGEIRWTENTAYDGARKFAISAWQYSGSKIKIVADSALTSNDVEFKDGNLGTRATDPLGHYERHGSFGATDYVNFNKQKLAGAARDRHRYVALHELGHALDLCHKSDAVVSPMWKTAPSPGTRSRGSPTSTRPATRSSEAEMNKLVLGTAFAVTLAAAGVGLTYVQQDDAVQAAQVESLRVATSSDAAEAARAQNLALVDVVDRGPFLTKGADAGLQTFKVHTLAVFKGTLPTDAEIGLPQGAEMKVPAGGRYEVSVIGPDNGTWLARFTRPVPTGQTTEAIAAHWKSELDNHFVEPPCSDITPAP